MATEQVLIKYTAASAAASCQGHSDPSAAKRKVSELKKKAEVEARKMPIKREKILRLRTRKLIRARIVGSQIKETELWKSDRCARRCLRASQANRFTVAAFRKGRRQTTCFKIQVEAEGEL